MEPCSSKCTKYKASSPAPAKKKKGKNAAGYTPLQAGFLEFLETPRVQEQWNSYQFFQEYKPIFHFPNKNYCGKVVQILIEPMFLKFSKISEGDQKYPYVNYMYSAMFAATNGAIYVEEDGKTFMHFLGASVIEFIYCIFKIDGVDHALGKAKKMPCLGVIKLDKIKKSRIYKEFISYRKAFTNLLEKFRELLVARRNRYVELTDTYAYVWAPDILAKLTFEIGNLHAECRFLILQLNIGELGSLISDPTNRTAAILIENVITGKPFINEHSIADDWIRKMAKKGGISLWDVVEAGECRGFYHSNKQFTVDFYLEHAKMEAAYLQQFKSP